jgi:hypothetical protein
MKVAAAKHVNGCNVAKLHVTVKDGSYNSNIVLPETAMFLVCSRPASSSYTFVRLEFSA